MNLPAVLLGLLAYGSLGVAYINWRAHHTNNNATPLGFLRLVDDKAESDPTALHDLPTPLIVAAVSAAYVAAIVFWPYLAARRLALTVTGRR